MYRIAFIFALLLLATSAYAEESQTGKKYEDYTFEPVYKDIIDESFVRKTKEVLDKALEPFWEAKIISHLSIGDNIAFLYRAEVFKHTREYRDYYKNERKKGGKPKPSRWDAVRVIGPNTNTLLDKREIRSGRLFPEGHAGYDYYGCINEYPLFKANTIDIDRKDLFTITGYGISSSQMGRRNCYPVNENIILSIYSGKNFEKLLAVELMLLNYVYPEPECVLKDYFYSAFKERPRNKAIPYLPCPDGRGRKRFGKVFIKDFNKNDKLDILVWYRQYQSRKLTQGPKGFDLEKQWFVWHEENNSGGKITFTENTIHNSLAQQWLKEFKLTWTKGFPDKNMCAGGKIHLPMIVDIEDPVLEE